MKIISVIFLRKMILENTEIDTSCDKNEGNDSNEGDNNDKYGNRVEATMIW